MKPRILIVDDEPEMLSACAKIVSMLGNEPTTISEAKVAVRLLEREEFDLIFSDLLMPEHDGIEVLEFCRKLAPATPVIIFSAYGTVDRVVTAMKTGAFDFIEKPFDVDNLKLVIEKGLRQRSFLKERNNLIEQLNTKYSFDNLVGKSTAMKNVFEMVETVSNSEANILITGESGTGKELIARSIHARGRRKVKAFVPVNCGAFPENLFEAELFGYERGAFTGASHRKIGLIEYADGGTFFLDEVCELPLSLQTKLLRTLQDQKLRRVGGNDLIQVNVRLISATNRDVHQALKDGSLRKDFYYRLNVIEIRVPALRDRREDIRLLCEHFLKKCLLTSYKEIEGFSDEALDALENYNWPGNVRELENVIERAVTLSKQNKIYMNDLPQHLSENYVSENNFNGSTLSDIKNKTVKDLEKKYLISLMDKHHGNITNVSKEAGLTRRHIYRLINGYNINPKNWRGNQN